MSHDANENFTPHSPLPTPHSPLPTPHSPPRLTPEEMVAWSSAF